MDNLTLASKLEDEKNYTPYILGNMHINVKNITKKKEKIPQTTLQVDTHTMCTYTCNLHEVLYTLIPNNEIMVVSNKQTRIPLKTYLDNIFQFSNNKLRRKNNLITQLESVYFRYRSCFVPSDSEFNIVTTCEYTNSYLCVLCTSVGTQAFIQDTETKSVLFSEYNNDQHNATQTRKYRLKDSLDNLSTNERNIVTVFYVPIYVKKNHHTPLTINKIKNIDHFSMSKIKDRNTYVKTPIWEYNLAYMGSLAEQADLTKRQFNNSLVKIYSAQNESDFNKIAFYRNSTIPIIADVITYEKINDHKILPKMYINSIIQNGTLHNNPHRVMNLSVII